jgi:hypothetical protein
MTDSIHVQLIYAILNPHIIVVTTKFTHTYQVIQNYDFTSVNLLYLSSFYFNIMTITNCLAIDQLEAHIWLLKEQIR